MSFREFLEFIFWTSFDETKQEVELLAEKTEELANNIAIFENYYTSYQLND